MLSIASRIWLTRNFQSLGGTYGLTKDALTQRLQDSFSFDELDGMTKEFFEIALEPEYREQAHRRVELDQEINVTLRPSVSACHRAKYRERRDVAVPELVLVG
jgi:hypothetical protein